MLINKNDPSEACESSHVPTVDQRIRAHAEPNGEISVNSIGRAFEETYKAQRERLHQIARERAHTGRASF